MTTAPVKADYPMSDAAHDDVSGITHGARRAINAVKETASDGIDAVGDTVKRAADGVRSMVDDPARVGAAMRNAVREHPLTAVAAVALVAFALGRTLVSR